MRHSRTYYFPNCGTSQTIEVEDGYSVLCTCPNCGETFNFGR